MTLKIDKIERGKFTIFVLSGRIDADHIPELTLLFEFDPSRTNILDLKETKLVDREAIRFLIQCEAKGIKLKNRPAYVREWMKREKV